MSTLRTSRSVSGLVNAVVLLVCTAAASAAQTNVDANLNACMKENA